MDRDAENDRLRTLNAKLLTACKMYDDEWTAAFPAGPQVSAGRLCRNTIAIWEAMREVIAEAEKGATP
jgi:hypothetical protein